MKKGWNPSEETRRKMSLAQKGRKRPDLGVINKTSAHREAVSIGRKNWSGIKEAGRKLGLSRRGKKMPEGYIPWNKGLRTVSIEKRRKQKSFIENKRRAIKNNAEGSHTFGEWETLKAQYNWTCPCCHKSEPEIKLTQDHIVPLSKGGSNNIENIQPLCNSCNSKKWTQIIKYD
ncbi:MAG: HNH endonuclease [Candidatus Daviesbacteria bacterium]|nr:HNH endonuclease [Candidatus Daviesbacteria bacterium]